MAAVNELHGQAIDATRDVVVGISDDQWDQSTPCEEWNVRELVNHIVSGHLWASELAAGKTIEEVGDRFDDDVVGDDPLGAYERAGKLTADVFNAPGALDAPCAVSYGPVPGEIYCGHRFIDTLIHGWDLAKATGQPTDLDPELVQGAIEVVEPQKALLQESGMFAGDVDAPADADPQAMLLSWLGRQA